MTRICLAAVLTAVVLTAAARSTAGGMILPGIRGSVIHGSSVSGSPSLGQGVSGASLRLYQDDGDGVFEPGSADVQVGPDYLTGADGSYVFEGLDPNAGFFVQRAALAVGGILVPAAVSDLLMPGEIRLMIDAFDTNQGVKANPDTPMATSTRNDMMSNVLGDERDMYVQILGGTGEVALRSRPFDGAVLQYDTGAGTAGQAILTWDGVDESAKPIPSLKLGDVDLTENGANEGLLFRLGIDATGATEQLRIRIFDESPMEYSEASITFPVTDGTATAFAYMPFSDFDGSVSPTKVNAIQMILGDGAKSVDAQVDDVGATGPVIQDFVVVPEPSAIVLTLVGALSLLGGLRRQYVAARPIRPLGRS